MVILIAGGMIQPFYNVRHDGVGSFATWLLTQVLLGESKCWDSMRRQVTETLFGSLRPR
jgi:hypothetical protein